MLAGITNASIVVDPHGELTYGAEHRIPFAVSEADYGLDVFLLCPAPGYVSFELETPDGSRINPGNLGGFGTGEIVSRGVTTFYRVSLPAIPADERGSHGGTWQAVLAIGKRPSGNRLAYLQSSASAGGRLVLPYDVLVHSYSNLVFSARGVQTSYEPGAVVKLYASLKEYDVPVDGRARVWAELTRPDASSSLVALAETEPGQFAGEFTTTLPGVYRARVRARGETIYGTPFTREQTVSAVAIPGGDRPSPSTPPDKLRDLICCLLSSRAITPESLRRLFPGIDPELVLRCLKKLCAERDVPERRKPGNPG